MIKFNGSLLFVFLFINFATGVDYCKLCDNHVGCKPLSGFGPACKNNAQIVTLTQAQKDRIVGLHNKLRNQVGAGNLNGFSAAKRMATIQWNDELASLALILAKNCTMAHDACRKTEKFSWAGQNLAVRSYSNKFGDTNTDLDYMIMLWFNEYSAASMSIIANYKSTTGPEYGHFTELVQDKNTHVGCALVNYYTNNWYNSLLACNYAMTNVLGRPVYVSGTACSGCTTGCNPSYPGLCKIGENIIPVP